MQLCYRGVTYQTSQIAATSVEPYPMGKYRGVSCKIGTASSSNFCLLTPLRYRGVFYLPKGAAYISSYGFGTALTDSSVEAGYI